MSWDLVLNMTTTVLGDGAIGLEVQGSVPTADDFGGGTPSMGSFPTTPILDDFNRPDGGLGADWEAQTGWAPDTLQIVSEQVADVADAGGGLSTWTPDTFTDCEVYATMAEPANVADVLFALFARWTGAFGTTYIQAAYTSDGAQAIIEVADSDGGFALTEVPLAGAGSRFGMSVVGDQVNLYLDSLTAVTVTGFTPASGVVGDPVDVTGTGFTGATEVDFGGVPATSFTVADDGHLTADVPAGAVTGLITVTSPAGSGSSFVAFVVTTSGAPVNVSPPVIVGLPYTGHSLKVASYGSWEGAPTGFSVQWYADAAPIVGETGVEILLDSDEVAGQSITAHIVATNGSGSSSPAASNALVVAEPIPAAGLPYRSPAWRFVVLDLVTFEVLSFLDVLATNRTVNYVLDQWTQADMVVPSDSPEVNIPWPAPDSDPFLTEGSRTLLGMRRDGPPEAPWTPRFHGIIMQLEDAAQADNAYSHITAYDPWKYLLSRPVCKISGALPGPKGLSFTATRIDVIIGTLLLNTIVNQGVTGIDLGALYGGTGFYSGTIEMLPQIDINFQQGLSVGEAWQQLTNQSDCDITLRAIYDPFNRPGYLAEASIYAQAGTERDDAIFAWDKPSRSLVQISRMLDGTLRANKVKFFAGLGGSAPSGSSIPVQTDAASVAKYGEYWRQQFFPAQNIASIVTLLAQSELALSKTGRETVTISPAPERSPIPFDDYFLGDRVPVYASDRLRAPLSGYQRIYGIPIEIADDATEQVQQLLTTEQGS